MNPVSLLFLLSVLFPRSVAALDADVETMFFAFKVAYNRKYDTKASEAIAFAAFVENTKIAARHQRENPHAAFGVNEFSDISADAFRSRFGAIKEKNTLFDNTCPR